MTEGSMIQKFLDFAANTSFNYVTQLTLNIEPTAMTPPMVPHSLCLGEKRPRKDMAELKLFLAFFVRLRWTDDSTTPPLHSHSQADNDGRKRSNSSNTISSKNSRIESVAKGVLELQLNSL